MKVTTGIDMIEVERIKQAVCEIGDNFLSKIYTKDEIAYCKKSEVMQYQHFAARFAGKEAIFKALSGYIGGRKDVPWTEMEIINKDDGRPQVNIDRLKKLGLEELESIDISISHIKEYAVANVVATFLD